MAFDEIVAATQKVGSQYTPSEAGFVDDGGVRGLQCGECANFLPGGGVCAIVSGIIDASDVCNFFDPTIAIGDMDAQFAKARSSFDMFITKASQDPETGEKRWAAVASDTDKDSFGDNMSLQLYADFIERIEQNEVAPAVFTSEAWQGGMPYLGLSHYLDLGGPGIIGDPSSIYVDGNRLKAKGVFRSTPLGDAAFEAIKADQQNKVQPDDRIRISIAFVDWEHAHGDEIFTRQSLDDSCPQCARAKDGKMYKKGQLVHLALTRVPVNERTPIWLEERAMAKTMKEDALSVLGKGNEALVEELDELQRAKVIHRSMVIKSDEEGVATEEAEVVERSLGGATTFEAAETYIKQSEEVSVVFDHFFMLDSILFNIQWDDSITDKSGAMTQAVAEFKARVDSAVKRSLAIRAANLILEAEHEEGEPMTEKPEGTPAPVEPKVVPAETPIAASPLDGVLVKLRAAVESATGANDKPIEDRLSEIQPIFNELADVVKASVKGEDVANAEVIASAIAQTLRAELGPLTEAIQLLAAKSGASKPEGPMIPGPRAYSPPPLNAQGEKPKSALTSMIRKSVGLTN